MSDWYDWSEAAYHSIGVQTTLPGKTNRKQNPIGFIWPKKTVRRQNKLKKAKR